MSKLIIDRFENDKAVCIDENGKSTDVSKSLLPAEAKVGCTIIKSGSSFKLDAEDTKARKERIEKKMSKAFKD